MASFDMSYYAEDDLLEAVFAEFDEHLSRSVQLNDSITLYTDPGTQTALGITFYAYARLLGVSETEFTGIREASDEELSAILRILSSPPASLFFDITDPDGLIARVLSPNLQDLVQTGSV